MLFLIRKMKQTTRRYRKNREGATAVEFAFLIVPFCMLLFAVLELGIIFFVNATLNHAVSEVSRQIRVGEFQATDDTDAGFKNAICAKMKGLGNCPANLRIDVVTTASGNFEPNMLPVVPTPPDPAAPAPDPSVPPPIEPNNYTSTPGRAPVMVRAQYHYKLALPNTMTRLANTRGNVRILESVTAFRNEPF